MLNNLFILLKKNFRYCVFPLLLLILNLSEAKAQWITQDSTLSGSGSYPSLGWPSGVLITIPPAETVTVTVNYGGGDLLVYGDLIITGGAQIDGNIEILPGASVTTGGNFTTMFVVVDSGAHLTVNGDYNTNNNSPFELLSDYYNSGATVTINGIAHYNTGGLKLDTGTVLTTQELWFHNPNNYIYGTVNNAGTLTIASGPETIDCPGEIITGSIHNASSANAFHGSGYIKVANSFTGINAFTPDTTIVLDLSTATGDTSGNRGAAAHGVETPCLAIPLPITLVSFIVQKYKDGNSALLQWQTATEKNNRGFHIEHSIDSKTWRALSFVHSLADEDNYAQSLNYQYIDKHPGIGINYYRLRQEDNDGHISYCPIRILDFRNSAEMITLYPNPTGGRAVLKGLSGGGSIIVNNPSGRLVRSFEVKGSEAVIDLSAYTNGIYFINVTDADGNTTYFKLTKE